MTAKRNLCSADAKQGFLTSGLPARILIARMQYDTLAKTDTATTCRSTGTKPPIRGLGWDPVF